MNLTRDERGDVGPLELSILAPVILAVLYFTVAFGRLVTAEGDVTHTSRAAARAAAAQASAGDAVDAARRVVNDTLTAADIRCVGLDVNVDTGSFEHGGTVTVTVACEVDLSNTESFPLPGTRTMTATASEIIDINRGGQ